MTFNTKTLKTLMEKAGSEWGKPVEAGSCEVTVTAIMIMSTGLPSGTVRGFTTTHNIMNQNDLEAQTRVCV